mgnify:FL=1
MKIKADGYMSNNVRVLTTECPHGEGCKVGSLTCSRCPKYQKRDGEYVYCSTKKGKADDRNTEKI